MIPCRFDEFYVISSQSAFKKTVWNEPIFLNCPEAGFFARVRRDRTSTVPDPNDLAARALLPPQKWGGKRAGEGFIARFAVFLVT